MIEMVLRLITGAQDIILLAKAFSEHELDPFIVNFEISKKD